MYWFRFYISANAFFIRIPSNTTSLSESLACDKGNGPSEWERTREFMDLISIIIIIFEFAASRGLDLSRTQSTTSNIFFFVWIEVQICFISFCTWIYLFHFYPALDLLVSTNFSIEPRPMYGDRCVCVSPNQIPCVMYIRMRSSTKEREDREYKKNVLKCKCSECRQLMFL